LQHELFEYDGRISQLVRILEIEVPRAIAILEKIVRHLDDYQATRARDPRSSYNDVALAKAIWADEKSDSSDDAETDDVATNATAADSESAGAASPQTGATTPREE
jgi:hypothetical protein